jgi:hypothetical protein
MKQQSDYQKTWQDHWEERMVLVSQRAALENDLSEINTKIKHLDGILDHLGPLAGFTNGDNLSGLGITDAIRAVLKKAEGRMSAAEVRTALSEKGFDFSAHTAPMASIYKVLSRLVGDSGEVERERDDDGSVFFCWKRSEEVAEDDIPF